MSNFLATIVFPASSNWQFIFNFRWLSTLIFGLLKWVYSIFGEYGLTIIFFTVLIRLIMVPMDFGNKYFTKKNSIKMAEMKPEDDAIKARFAGDPMALNRARGELHRKYNYSGGGFCLFTFINLILTLMIFMGVFTALREVSNFNLNNQYIELQGVYQTYESEGKLDTDEYRTAIIEKYDETNISFLWVKNIWRPDTWGSQTLNYTEFKDTVKDVPDNIVSKGVSEEEYNNIFNPIKDEKKGGNGLFLLILIAGAATFFSSHISTKLMAKKTEEKATNEPEAVYSIRKTKEQSNTQEIPQIDPAMMGNMMKMILPIVMIIFTLSSTAALALYIIVSSVVSTCSTLGISLIVDKVIARQKKKVKAAEPQVINPHAKYFKK